MDDLDKKNILEAIKKLPTRQRKAIVLKYRYHMSLNEIADRMGITKPAACNCISRGKKKLEEMLIYGGKSKT